MNAERFAAWITGTLVLSLQIATAWMLATEKMASAEYLGIWAPMLTLAIGYWFGQRQKTATEIAQ